MIGVSVDITEIHRALSRLGRFGRDLTPVWRAVKKPLMNDQRDHKLKQQGPDGRWPARSSVTDARLRSRARGTGRKRRRGKPLGRLPTAVNMVISRQKISLFSRVAWSGVHQDGAGRTGRAPRIPKRTFLWASRELLTRIVFIIEAQASKRWAP